VDFDVTVLDELGAPLQRGCKSMLILRTPREPAP